MDIKILLQKSRKEAGYTQKQMADRLNMSASGYAGWEQGLTEPSIENVKKICTILDITPNELLEFENEYEYTQKPPAKAEGYFNTKIESEQTEMILLFNELDRLERSRVRGIIEGILIQNGKNVDEILSKNIGQFN